MQFDNSCPTRMCVLTVLHEPSSAPLLLAALELDPSLTLVARCSSWREAFDWLDSSQADVALIYARNWSEDWTEGIRECRRNFPSCKVVVLADRLDPNNALDCLKAGAVGYLLCEPGRSDEVVSGLKVLRHGGTPINSAFVHQVLELIIAQLRPVDTVGKSEQAHARGGAAQQQLTTREHSVLSLMARGDTYAEVAGVLDITVRTVQTHTKNIYRKLSVHSRSEAVFEARHAGLLTHWA